MKKIIFICFLLLVGCFDSNAIGTGDTLYNNTKVSRVKLIKNGDILETKNFSNFKVIYKDEILYLEPNTKIQFLEKKKIDLNQGRVVIKGSYITTTKFGDIKLKDAFASVLTNNFVVVIKIYRGKCFFKDKIFKENNTLVINKFSVKEIKFIDFDKKLKENDIIKVK